MKTGRASEKQKQRLHKRDQTAVFSSSDEHTATGETDYLCVIQLGIIHVRCDLSKEKALSISSLTFSSCHGAKTPSAVKPERNAAAQLIAQLSLSLSLYSLCPISLAHCLPPSLASAMAALFCSPSLDSSSYPPYNLSHSPPLPSPGDSATAEQRRPLCLHRSH